MTKEFSQALNIFPGPLRQGLLQLEQDRPVEEIRLALGREPEVCFAQGRRSLPGQPVTAKLLQELLSAACGHAVYAAQDQLRQGFVTLPGGHRLGLCGTAVYQDGQLQTLRQISSCCLRIARPVWGCADRAADHLWTHPRSCLIFGPPGRGKTTLLRDLVRQLSQRFFWRIGLVDERMELAACLEGRPQFELGPTTDVLSGVRKGDGIEMLLRSMRPEWIALDEISAQKDVEALIQASYCGLRFLATAHAASAEELRQRPVYRQLLEAGIFENFLRLRPDRRIQVEERP